jgi:hypothetical protein
MQFKPRNEYGPRAKLAEAIQAAAQCEAAVHDLEVAETRGFERKMEAERRLDALKERHEHQDDGAADAFIASISSGGDGSIDVLDAPSRQRAAEIEALGREVAMLGRVRAEIAERIPAARQAADDAKRKVADLAKQVLAEKIDPDRLIATAEGAYAALAAATARIRFASSLLPFRSPDEERLRLWPEFHFRNESKYQDYRQDPANADLAKALEALMRGDVSAIDLAP